jgi:hypothetical protein
VSRAHGSEHSVTVRQLRFRIFTFNFKVKRETEKKDIEDKIIRSEVEIIYAEVEKVRERAEVLQKKLVDKLRVDY